MRFTIQNLCWLMVATAIIALVARQQNVDTCLFTGLAIFLGYFTAPLWLTLASSFFQAIPAKKRNTIVCWLLFVLAGLPTLGLLFVSPMAAGTFAAATCLLWLQQLLIVFQIHERQEEAECKTKREKRLKD